jgi:hypothetical protein
VVVETCIDGGKENRKCIEWIGKHKSILRKEGAEFHRILGFEGFLLFILERNHAWVFCLGRSSLNLLFFLAVHAFHSDSALGQLGGISKKVDDLGLKIALFRVCLLRGVFLIARRSLSSLTSAIVMEDFVGRLGLALSMASIRAERT